MVSFSDPPSRFLRRPGLRAAGGGFSWLGNFAQSVFSRRKQNQFQDQQNQNTTQQQQAFKNGIPLDANGNPDYRAITQMLAQKGDINAISQLAPYVQFQGASTQASQPDPMLANLPGGGQQPQSAPAPQPQKTPATQQGGDQAGSIVDVVTAKIPQEQAGPTIARIAQVTGIDPNAALTPGQQVRVNGLVQRYAQPAASPQGRPRLPLQDRQPAPGHAPAAAAERARASIPGFRRFRHRPEMSHLRRRRHSARRRSRASSLSQPRNRARCSPRRKWLRRLARPLPPHSNTSNRSYRKCRGRRAIPIRSKPSSRSIARRR